VEIMIPARSVNSQELERRRTPELPQGVGGDDVKHT
jgi:hypothetical protein